MTVDPVELIKRLQPPAGWTEPTDLERDPRDAAVLARVLGAPDEEFTATAPVVADLPVARRRRRLVAAILATTLLAGGAAAALWPRAAVDPTRLACWTEADAAATSIVEVGWDGVADPVERCAAGFAAERLPVPGRLAACDAGHLVVVAPGGADVCERLGMTRFSGPPDG